MFKNRFINLFILFYIMSFNIVFAATNSKVEISSIVFMTIVVIYNLICSKDDNKKRMILTNIFTFDFSNMEINYVIVNIIRLIFILAYYFFVIPIIIDFIIATILLIIRIIKKEKK